MKRSIAFVSELLITLIIFAMSFLTTYVLNSYGNLKVIEKANSGYLSRQAITFCLNEDVIISPHEVSDILESGNYLFQKTGDRLEDMTLFSYADGVFFDITEGRQFTQDDLELEQELRMMGQIRMEENTGSAETIAVWGFKTPTLLDYASIVLPSVSERQYLSSGTWIIDGPRKVEESFENLCEAIGASQMERIPTEQIGIYRMSSTNRMNYRLLCFVILCCALTYIPTIMFWIECRNELYLLTGFLGVRSSTIGLYLLRQFIVPVMLALAIGTVVATCSLTAQMEIDWRYACAVFIVGITYVVATYALAFSIYRSKHTWNEVK